MARTEPIVAHRRRADPGIDVATKAEVHRLLESLAAEERVAVLMISSELPEVLRMGNRSLVMREGRIVAEFFPQ